MKSLQNLSVAGNRNVAVVQWLVLAIAGALMMFVSSPTSAFVQGQAVEGKFRRSGRPIPNQYIVVLNDDIAGQDVSSIAGDLTRIHGGNIKHTYRYALNGFSVHNLPEAAAIALSQDPRVEFVEENGLGSVGGTQTNPPWGLDRIDQRDLPLDDVYNYPQTGAGINVYVIDTGIRTTHQDFGGRASFGADFVGDGQNGADCFGHGTLVASIGGGDRANAL